MIKIVVFTAIGLLLGTAAYAQNVHLKPPNRNPTFVDQGLTLQVVGNLAGLGGGDVVITLNAEADVTATCTNPSGATQPPGQNPAPISVTGVEPIPEEEIKNGTVAFNVETDEPVTPIPGAPDCPNPKWTEAIEDLAFTSATIVVEQPAGTEVLTVTCTFAAPTEDGAVPTGNVSCTSDGTV
ncbi:MAG TPA: hypothetical protein VFE34_20405 [Dongiaceae bacterium]|nr:hypothetical protein [Dongiaceae bacterium]